MKKTAIDQVAGAYVIEIDRFYDERGYFQEAYSWLRYDHHTLSEVMQTNVSHSRKGVVRGLHVAPYSKLCTCIRGALFDVVADVRPDSPTYGNWFGVWLDDTNCKELFVPEGCAHGFFAAENNTILMYQQDGTYSPEAEYEINWRDPTLAIEWPEADDYILSTKDANAPMLQG